MDENTFKLIAQNLRKPEGEAGKQTGLKMNTGNKLITEWTMEKVAVSSNDKLLEIGMGNGFFVKDILSGDSSISYAGCDYSDIMVEEACKMNKEFIERGQAQFFLTSADKLPFEKGSFNKIFTVNTIYFWENPAEILAEFRRVLKPKGRLVIGLRPEDQMKHYPFVKYGFTTYSKEAVATLLSNNAFEVSSMMEKQEPEQEINGVKLQVGALVVCAERID